MLMASSQCSAEKWGEAVTQKETQVTLLTGS